MDLLTEYYTQFGILGAILLSTVLGGLIGLEREDAQKPAGLRTHMLVAGSVTLIMSVGEVLFRDYVEESFGSQIQGDPLRLIEAIVAGVSFLGAGTILRHRGKAAVEGLTTAASILYTAGIGIAVSLELYVLSVGATVLGLIVLRLINIFERRVGLDEEDEQGTEE